MQLTAAGEAFLDTARAVLTCLDEGVAYTRRVALGFDGQLRLNFIALAHYPVLLETLRDFRRSVPTVAFTMQEASTHEQMEVLVQARLNITMLSFRQALITPCITSYGWRFFLALKELMIGRVPVYRIF